MDRFAVLLNTSTDEVGQTANGLEYALDLDESGKEVEVFFDGSATEWPGELAANPEHPVTEAFEEAQERGLLAGACSACAGAFETTAFGPLDRRVTGVAAAVGACGIAVVAGLAYSAPTIAAVAAGFAGPFGVVALRSAWQWALPAA